MRLLTKLGPLLAALGVLSRPQDGAEQSLSVAESTSPIVNFQVAQPLTFSSKLKTCTVEVIHHNFGNSYWQPAIAEWKVRTSEGWLIAWVSVDDERSFPFQPPVDCGDPLQWIGVSGNYTATSNGVRLGALAWRECSNRS